MPGPMTCNQPGVVNVVVHLKQDDQRRVSNRENVRDEFFGLLRDAAAGAAPFAQSGPPAGFPAGHGAHA